MTPEPAPAPAPPAPPPSDPLDRLFGDVQVVLRDLRREQAAQAQRIASLEGVVADHAKALGETLERRFKKWLEEDA